MPRVGPGHSLSPCPFTSQPSTLFYFSLCPFLIRFTYFLILSIPSLSTRTVPLCFQARGYRKRQNLGFSFFVFILCYLYFLVKDACFFVMAALCSRCGHLFLPCGFFFLSIFFFFPRLISVVADWMFTILLDMVALLQI